MAYIMQSGLSAELVDLVYLRVSQINNCAYCLDTHTRDLIKKGVKIEKLALVPGLGGSWPSLQRA
jgi:AhpD family alkylhydroperoxidase